MRINNAQQSMETVFNYQIGIALARALKDKLSKLDDRLLQGRSVNGIYFEMLMHFGGHMVGKYSSADITDIGGINKGYGGDNNAYIFEAPIRNLRDFVSLF